MHSTESVGMPPLYNPSFVVLQEAELEYYRIQACLPALDLKRVHNILSFVLPIVAPLEMSYHNLRF